MKTKNSGDSNLSIRSILIFVFILTMIISVGSMGYLIFSNWISSAKQTTESIAKDMNRDIYTQIDSFLGVPENINDLNGKILENGIFNLSNENERDKFFVSVLNMHENEIYSVSVGTVKGEYYGARRNELGRIEIMRNNAETGGNSWYYSVDENLNADELVVQAGKFDPRTRDWYKAAVEEKGPVYSPIYKHFVMNDLTVSAAQPVYNDLGELQGVLGTHMILSGIGSYLSEIVRDNKGYAFIVEKNTGEVVANSLGKENFIVPQDGKLKRYTLSDIDSTIGKAYEQYNSDRQPNFLYEGEKEGLYVNVEEYHKAGLDWVIISVVPEGLLTAEVTRNIQMTLVLTILALVFSFLVYYFVTKKLLNPMQKLLEVTESLSSGDLSQRVVVVRNDEIGRISEAFNKVADKMHFLINNLEATVKLRTEELNSTNEMLEENKNQLRLILDTAAEAIYGVDLEGNCTFCNTSCINILGYKSQEDLLGKNMHQQIHHSFRDGTPFPIEQCKIIQSIQQGEGRYSNDEVFWKADGTFFEVEYHAHPQYKDRQIIGAVVSFMDITERKKKEERIRYLSYHDALTGLMNRQRFESELRRIDTKANLPISIIFADLNGLKLTNDIFGHASGDLLIMESAVILKKTCRDGDIVARIGGDEFVILLPHTEAKDAEKIIERVQAEISHKKVNDLKCSMALGYDTKTSSYQEIDMTLETAENNMYQAKSLTKKSIGADTLQTIMTTLHKRSPREMEHSVEVSKLCVEIGQAMGLPETKVKKLSDAGYLHDIGKITLNKEILTQDKGNLTESEKEKLRQHSMVGYRILNLFEDTLDLAEGIYGHHEKWDGSGYPKGIKGEQIPIMARVIALAEAYDKMTSRWNPNALSKKVVLEKIKQESGTKYDPQIVEVFLALKQKDIYN